MKKLFALVVIVGFIGQGCASTGGPKQAAYQGLSAAKEALNLVSTTLLGVECGKATAPIAPACVPSDKADVAWEAIRKAATAGEKATGLVRALPANLNSSTPPAEVANLVSQIWATIWEVAKLFQHPAAPALNKKLTSLSHE